MIRVKESYQDETGGSLTVVDEELYSVVSYEELAQRAEAKRRKAAIEAGGVRSYVTAYHGPVRKLNDILNLNEIGAIMKLLPYMRFDRAGALMDGTRRMGIVEIARVIGKAQRWTTELVRSLVHIGVLAAERAGKRNVYNVSETYHTIGHVLQDTPYTKIYQAKTRVDIAKVSIQAAGFLYKMIPFIHYEKLYLSYNPNERDPLCIRHLSQAKLAEEIGVDGMTAVRCMRELISAGFVMRLQAYGALIIRMNPDVMFRKRMEYDSYTNHVRAEFEQVYGASIQGVTDRVVIDERSLPF